MSWQEIQQHVDRSLRDGIGSAMACGVRTASGFAWEHHAGKTRQDDLGVSITSETLFDLASLTKVFATTTLLARYVDQGKLSMSEDLRSVLADLPWASGTDTTLHSILVHQAGFARWLDFSNASDKQEILRSIAQAKVEYAPTSTVIYSDLGFILLAEYLEKRFQRPLEDLVMNELQAISPELRFLYNPIEHGVDRHSIVATENTASRGGVIQGQVHDGNTWKLGGVSTHAGLFGSLKACLAFSELWLHTALGTNGKFLSRATADMFLRKYPAKDGQVRALGWDVATPPNSMAGKNVSLRAFGHSGYTGTSVFLDLEREAAVVLLTNRVHPKDEKTGIGRLRPAFHDMVWKELDR